MFAVARDLYLSSGVFALLAAVLFVGCDGAPASRMRTFLWLDIGHDIPSFRALSCLLFLAREGPFGGYLPAPGGTPRAGGSLARYRHGGLREKDHRAVTPDLRGCFCAAE
jgi:hypothetical protein